jgi:hypothetical protein
MTVKVMSVDTAPGTQVAYADPDAGWPSDRDRNLAAGLHVGSHYTVERIVPGRYCTLVYLAEFPGATFNSVSFSNV